MTAFINTVTDAGGNREEVYLFTVGTDVCILGAAFPQRRRVRVRLERFTLVWTRP